MISISSLDDIAALRESFDVECKLAQGRDGKGACPKSLWETYSAFANSQGGDLFLGLEEQPGGQFKLAGIENAQKVIDELWTGLNDRDLVSCNVLRSDGIRCIQIDGLNIIHVHVPQASRTQRPVTSIGGLGDSIGGSEDRTGGIERLEVIAAPVAARKKAPRVEIEQAILQMCRLQPCTLDLLAQLLKRSDGVIRKDYLQPMIKDRRLRYRYPTMPKHPEQAYVADGEQAT